MFVASLLMIALCYGPLFWGMMHVTSGAAAVLEMSLTPVALLGFGVVLGQERWNWVSALAMGLGAVGLTILFAPSLGSQSGAGAGSALGSARRRLGGARLRLGFRAGAAADRAPGGATLSGATMLIGGLVLLLSSLALEPGAARALTAFWGWPAIAGWLFLVLFGSLIGYSLYMQLLRDIGPAKAGSFAFVSPAVAVLVGVAVAGETVSGQAIAGMAVMLLAVGLCLYGEPLQDTLAARCACEPA